jgi:hypothetical protein
MFEEGLATQSSILVRSPSHQLFLKPLHEADRGDSPGKSREEENHHLETD